MTDFISSIVKEAIHKQYQIEAEPLISSPAGEFGDFATNIAFMLAKELKKAPNEIAGQIAGAINHPDVEMSRAVNGFVNLTMASGFWVKQLSNVSQDFAKGEKKNQKVQVEFISANPTGPLTLGNARGGYTGDVLARVLDHLGYDVTREYYFNDAGTQIGLLKESFEAAKAGDDSKEVQYKGSYIKELVELSKNSGEDSSKWLTSTIFEQYIKPAIEKMGVVFNEYFNESSLKQQYKTVIDLLKKDNLVHEKDGALWLKSTKFGDERDRVLEKSSGDVTYLGNDLAYHFNIFEQRKFDRAIKVWGADHAGQVPSLRLAVGHLFPDKFLDFVILQWVRLMRNGQEVKMSKRAGTYVTVEELIDEVGSDVARFFFLMRSADTAMDFDLDLAKEQSQKNPLFYVMYSYARANSIMEQAKLRRFSPVSTVEDLTGIEKALIRQISQLPQILEEIRQDYGVHRLTFFGIETAKLFHDLYEAEKIIDLDKAEASKKLYLIQQYITFMEVYFSLLGVTPVKKMVRGEE
jgi:arginyl-tRNA synthetase